MFSWNWIWILDVVGAYKILTHLRLASYKWDIGKQCRPRSDTAVRGVWFGSALFALNTLISINLVIMNTNQTPLILEMDRSKEWLQKSSFGINGLMKLSKNERKAFPRLFVLFFDEMRFCRAVKIPCWTCLTCLSFLRTNKKFQFNCLGTRTSSS